MVNLSQANHAGKAPQQIFNRVYAFSPNRDTLGGTAYFILENKGNTLVDCPAWNRSHEDFIQFWGGIKALVLTHRGGIGEVAQFQQHWDCEILIQEQEAYLLPGLRVTPFQHTYELSEQLQLIWTPGHSPGSACLYYGDYGGVLFSGRHLLPNAQAQPAPLRTAKTFHWGRQLQSVQLLRDRFTADTLSYLCPGANTGLLRGERTIPQAYAKLAQLDLSILAQASPQL